MWLFYEISSYYTRYSIYFILYYYYITYLGHFKQSETIEARFDIHCRIIYMYNCIKFTPESGQKLALNTISDMFHKTLYDKMCDILYIVVVLTSLHLVQGSTFCMEEKK